jgi:uncharacterized protein
MSPPSKSQPAGGVRVIRCPACGGKSRYASDNPYRPFCSERCRNLDLGAWASESYRVASPPAAADDGAPDEPSDARH